MLLKGSFTETSSRGSLDWKPFSFGFNLPDEQHTGLVHRAGAHFLIVEVTADWLTRSSERPPMLETFFTQGGSLTSLGLKLHREVQHPDDVSPLAIEGIFLEMLAEVSRKLKRLHENCPPPRWLEQVRELIHATFPKSVSLGFLAESVGVHPVHVARMFRKNYHCTIGDYVRQLRVEFVCREISTTEAPFREIALAAGFCDQSHLARIFKRHTGMTPAQYRSFARAR